MRNLEFLAYIFVWKVNGSNSQIISYLALGQVFDRLLFNEIDGQLNTMIWTPFTYLLHHPMQIYLGKYSALETLYVFGGGIVWCVILYYLVKWVFKMGLKRNEAIGL